MTLDTYTGLFEDVLDAVSTRLKDVRANNLWGLWEDLRREVLEMRGTTGLSDNGDSNPNQRLETARANLSRRGNMRILDFPQ
jgi:hypothetical protein